MLAAHWENNPNAIYFKAKGRGGANEMATFLEDSEVMYALGEKYKNLLDNYAIIAKPHTLRLVNIGISNLT